MVAGRPMREHPYLFEQHRNLDGLLRTLACACRPTRFFRKLRPWHTLSAGALLVYLLLGRCRRSRSSLLLRRCWIASAPAVRFTAIGSAGVCGGPPHYFSLPQIFARGLGSPALELISIAVLTLACRPITLVLLRPSFSLRCDARG